MQSKWSRLGGMDRRPKSDLQERLSGHNWNHETNLLSEFQEPGCTTRVKQQNADNWIVNQAFKAGCRCG